MPNPRRSAKVIRKTTETDIRLRLVVDGTGRARARTRIPFFDHMLTLFAKHSLMDLDVTCQGDVEVDFHHTVEDVGICLGQALARALGDKRGIRRYGSAYLPMDETLARAVIDLSGRPFLEYRARSRRLKAGDFPIQLVEEFLRAFAMNAACNLHVELLYGRDPHHIAEAIFKGLAKALDAACARDPRVRGLPSTKNLL
ncbi:MAG: imidazoleglycerol-phosphate dehydratase HisB [Verrucomicrobiae bacterium]|nr:imidazoleglycerol-phosphate dehydratase HisB [Verrucomicrobiae bacterium]